MGRPRAQSERRQQLDFAIEELEWRRDLLLEMAPRTDHEAYVLWRARALERAIAELKKPYFEVSPLL